RAGDLEPRRDFPGVLHERAREELLAAGHARALQTPDHEDVLARVAGDPVGVETRQQPVIAERLAPHERAAGRGGRRALRERERLAVAVERLRAERAVKP